MILPSVMDRSRFTMRIEVVLPHPEGPMNTQISPSWTVRSSPLTAAKPSGKRLTTFWNSITRTPFASALHLLDAGRGEQTLDGAESRVQHERQADRRNGAEQNLVDGRVDDALNHEVAEPAGADDGGDGPDADEGDAGVPHAGHDDGEGERKLDLHEALRRGHAHAATRIDDGVVDVVQAGVGVADERQQR